MEKVYNLFKGHTYYIQKTFNEAFAETAEGGECTMETIRAAIDEMIASNDTIFREILSSLPRKSFWKRISSRDPGAGAGSGAFCYCVAGYSSLYTFIPLTRASGGVRRT